MNRARGSVAAMCSLVMLLIAACGVAPRSSSPSAAPPASDASAINVDGQLDRGTAPTCPAGEPCDPPITAYMLVFTRPGHADVAVRVGPDGSFATHLDPGEYSIAAQPPPFNSRLEPSSVRVPGTGAVDLRLQIVSSGS